MSGKALIAIALVAAAAVPASAGPAGARSGHGPTVQVSPSAGFPHTRFVVSFRAPDGTGRYGSRVRSYVLSASWSGRGPGVGQNCIGSVSLTLPVTAKGARVRVTLGPAVVRPSAAVGAALVPARPPGAWCLGAYHGEIAEIEGPVCLEDEFCPAFVLLRRVLGRFSFAVQKPVGRDTTRPAFAGIRQAFACTPGPQHPGQTTRFTLSWQPASDNVTPRSQIVYDVYSSNTPGGESFTHPTWTTAPGVTSFFTPGLASHGGFYFVVRARDQAGNEDQNMVERRGVDPCY